jgi:hypothetical protein
MSAAAITAGSSASPTSADAHAPVRAAAVAAFAAAAAPAPGATPKRRGRPRGSATGTGGSAGARALAKRHAVASPQAKTTAAVILEGLTGLRSAPEAARTLGVSVARYYAVEAQAIAGLLTACEPAPPGPAAGAASERELSRLRQDHRRQEQELARMRAILRTTQRSLGVAPVTAAPPGPSPASAGKPGKKRRHRRPVVRALTVVRKLLSAAVATPAVATSVSTTGSA